MKCPSNNYDFNFLKAMASEMMKKKKNCGDWCQLMTRTFTKRQSWVKTEEPTVHDILLKFPALRHPKVVRFCLHLKLFISTKTMCR